MTVGAVADPGPLRRRAGDLRSVSVVVDLIRAKAPSAARLDWGGPGADAYDWAHSAFVLTLTRLSSDAIRVAARLEALSDVLEAAQGEVARAQLILAAGPVEPGATAAQCNIERSLAEVERADRAAALELVDTVVFDVPVIEGPLSVVAMGRLIDPSGLAAWLDDLPPAWRVAVLEAHPELVGANPTAGLAERYSANLASIRLYADGELSDRIARLERTEAALRAAGMTLPVPHLNALRRYRRDLRRRVRAGRQFLHFDPIGGGRVVEVFGDLTSARHVAVLVPGITNTQFGYEDDLGADAATLWSGAGDLAVIAWLGYDTPGGGLLGESPLDPAALTVQSAVAGAAELRKFVDWLTATFPDALVSVLGHSYGSVVAATAAVDGLAVDHLFLLGSPGVPLQSAAAAKLRPGATVWASTAAGDPIDDLAAFAVLSDHPDHPDDPDGNRHALFHGVNPVHTDFGATLVPPFASRGHSAYFTVAGAAALRAAMRDAR